MERRAVLLGLLAAFGAALEGCGGGRAQPRAAQRRRVHRRARRQVRRRIRRRVAFRVIAGRRVAVVPFAVAAGWELSLGPRVVVVREVRLTTIVVADPAGGPPEEIDIQKEDNAENTPDDRGSPITDGDTSTPALVAEEDVDEEVDE